MKSFSLKKCIMFLLVGLSFIVLGCSKESKVQKVKKAKDSIVIKDLNALEASSLIKSKKESIQIIDIRTPMEFSRGHVKGAKNINFSDKELFVAELKKLDPSKQYLIYCRSGNRSSRSLEVFKQLNFRQIFHLKNGLISWEAAGLPLE